MAEQTTPLFGKGGAKYNITSLVAPKVYDNGIASGVLSTLSSVASLASTLRAGEVAEVKAKEAEAKKEVDAFNKQQEAEKEAEQNKYKILDATVGATSSLTTDNINNINIAFNEEYSKAESLEDKQNLILKFSKSVDEVPQPFNDIPDFLTKNTEGLSDVSKAKLQESLIKANTSHSTSIKAIKEFIGSKASEINLTLTKNIKEEDYGNKVLTTFAELSSGKVPTYTTTNFDDERKLIKEYNKGDVESTKKTLETPLRLYVNSSVDSIIKDDTTNSITKSAQLKQLVANTQATIAHISDKSVAPFVLSKELADISETILKYDKTTIDTATKQVHTNWEQILMGGRQPNFQADIKALNEQYKQAGYTQEQIVSSIDSLTTFAENEINKKKTGGGKGVFNASTYNSILATPAETKAFKEQVVKAMANNDLVTVRQLAIKDPKSAAGVIDEALGLFAVHLATIDPNSKTATVEFTRQLSDIKKLSSVYNVIPTEDISKGNRQLLQLAATIVDYNIKQPQYLIQKFTQAKQSDLDKVDLSRGLKTSIGGIGLESSEYNSAISDAKMLAFLGFTDKQIVTKVTESYKHNRIGDNDIITQKIANKLGLDANDFNTVDSLHNSFRDLSTIVGAKRGAVLATIVNNNKYQMYQYPGLPNTVFIKQVDGDGYEMPLSVNELKAGLAAYKKRMINTKQQNNTKLNETKSKPKEKGWLDKAKDYLPW